MPRIMFFAVFLSLSLAHSVSAKTVDLSWDPSPDSEVLGYKIYYNADSSAFPFNGSGAAEGSSPIDVGHVLGTTLTDLPDEQTHYFAVTAYNAEGIESGYSNIVISPAVGGSVVQSDSGSLEITSTTGKHVPVMDGWWLVPIVLAAMVLFRRRVVQG
ncbi:MAG: fibronectin type III domain-containing protein [Desulfuromonadales bacterium]|nr:fibronectin type III domain-containing protein [Desulfuromonadales bacterium]